MNKIIDLMKICETKGYSATASAAVVGNWIAEGALNEKNVSLDRFTNGYREVGALGFTAGVAESYLTWCRNNNKAWDDFVNQAEYALEKTVPAYYPMFHEFGIWRYFQEIRMYLNCYTTLDDFKKAVPDLIETATISFMCLWWSPTYKQIKGGLTWASRDSGKYELTFDERLRQEIRDRTKYAVQAYNEFMKEIFMSNIVNFPDYSQRKPPQAHLMTHVTWGMTCYEGGCGEMAIANGAFADPCEVWKWMCAQGYVIDDQGTTYDGMIAGMKKYMGSGSLLTPQYISGQISGEAYDKLEAHLKAGYCAVLLMGGTAKGCRTDGHAKNGHFEFAGGYENGNVYIYDSVDGFRTGWHGLRDAVSLYGLAGNIKLIFLCNIKWKKDAAEPIVGDDRKTCFTASFRQVEPGMKGMNEIMLLEAILGSKGYYDYKKYGLDLEYNKGRNLEKAVRAFQKDNGLVVDAKVGPATWRKLLNMTGTIHGSTLTVILRYKFTDGTGTTVTFVQDILTVLGFYTGKLDTSNGPGCQSGVKKYKTKYMGISKPNGCITLELIESMFYCKFA